MVEYTLGSDQRRPIRISNVQMFKPNDCYCIPSMNVTVSLMLMFRLRIDGLTQTVRVSRITFWSWHCQHKLVSDHKYLLCFLRSFLCVLPYHIIRDNQDLPYSNKTLLTLVFNLIITLDDHGHSSCSRKCPHLDLTSPVFIGSQFSSVSKNTLCHGGAPSLGDAIYLNSG